MSKVQFLLPSLLGKIVDCSGIFCPTFQSKRCISCSPTSTPVRVPAKASRSAADTSIRSEEHTSALQSLMRRSYAVFCLKKKTNLNSLLHISSHETYT